MNYRLRRLLSVDVWTADVHRPWAEAVAVRDDRIVAVGSRDEVEPLRGEKTRIIDAGTGMVVPGLIDSHVHMVDGGLRLSEVQLRDAATREEFVRRIGEYARSSRRAIGSPAATGTIRCGAASCRARLD